MKAFITALVAATSLVATPILAADLAVKAPPPPAPPPPTWTGCYLGVEAGYGWGRTRDTVNYSPPAAFAPVTTIDVGGTDSGAMGGAQVGCDYQWGNQWVVGVIATYDFADIAGNVYTQPVVPGVLPTNTHRFNEEIDGFGTVRGRIGWLFAPNWLVYGSGGLAYGRVVTSALTSTAAGITPLDPGEATWKTGWTAGGGVEWKFNPHISAFAEYLYAQLGPVSGRGETTPAGPAALVTDDYGSPKINVVKAGINWRY